MTIGDLKEVIYKLPKDTLITIERVEDVYFRNHNWKTITVQNQSEDWEDEFIESSSVFYDEKNKILCIKAHIN